jgi:hypothetical protein
LAGAADVAVEPDPAEDGELDDDAPEAVHPASATTVNALAASVSISLVFTVILLSSQNSSDRWGRTLEALQAKQV